MIDIGFPELSVERPAFDRMLELLKANVEEKIRVTELMQQLEQMVSNSVTNNNITNVTNNEFHTEINVMGDRLTANQIARMNDDRIRKILFGGVKSW